MIPIIGLMIAGYIVLRCFEMLAAPDQHWAGPGWAGFVRVLAVITMLGTVVLAADLILSGSSIPGGLPTP